MTRPGPGQRLALHIRTTLGDGPFRPARGWTHMGAVICDAGFHARRPYRSTLLPRLRLLEAAWPDAATVRGFRARLATEDLAVAMDFRSPGRVATAHGITALRLPPESTPATICTPGSATGPTVRPCAR